MKQNVSRKARTHCVVPWKDNLQSDRLVLVFQAQQRLQGQRRRRWIELAPYLVSNEQSFQQTLDLHVGVSCALLAACKILEKKLVAAARIE